jgi:hypothetical protein
MSVHGTPRTARRALVGVLVVCALVTACGGKGSPAATGPSGPASSAAESSAPAPSAPALSATSAPLTTAPATSAPFKTAPATSAASARPTLTAGTAAGSSAPASPSGLAAGQTGTRAQIPWNQVGPGWFLATSDSAPNHAEGAPAASTSRAGTVTLSLISPNGAQYVIASWPGYTDGSDPASLAVLGAWSPTRHQALLSYPGGGVIEVDLTTGVRREISVPNLFTAGFTQPTGANLVAEEGNPTSNGGWIGERLVRLDLSGKALLTLATADRDSVAWLYSPDGATVYLNGHSGLRSVSNSGGPIRDLATFETPDSDCAPVAWWDQHTILAHCSGDAGSRLWLVSAASGSATPLTPMPGTEPVGLGYIDAVRAGGTVFAQHLEGCGVVTVYRLAANGVGTRLQIPESLGNDRLIGTVGTKIAVQSSTECGSPSWFGFYDPATNTTQKIVPDVPGELGVLSALAFP